MDTKLYCVYLMSLPNGKYYIGKGVTSRVKSGRYKGSGRKLKEHQKKYPFKEWSVEIVEENLIEQEAYDLEEICVTKERLSDPLCLNLKTGGNKNFGYCHDVADKISKTHLGKKLSEEHKNKIRDTLIGRMTNPDSSAIAFKMGKANLGKIHSEDTRKLLSDMRRGRPWSEARRLAQKNRTEEQILATSQAISKYQSGRPKSESHKANFKLAIQARKKG